MFTFRYQITNTLYLEIDDEKEESLFIDEIKYTKMENKRQR